MTGADPAALVFSLGAGVGALLYAFANIVWVHRQASGNEAMRRVARAIHEGANAFLRTQYRALLLVAVLIAALLVIVPAFGWRTALGFVIGAGSSALAGYLGMQVSVRANVRTAQAARAGLAPALLLAVRAGSVTGFLVGALGLLSLTGFYMVFALGGNAAPDLQPLVGLGFGASLVSVFARLGGGIFTKAADVGADMVGKIESAIPEDDPRNPATIADNVGDNVGDCAGMAADLFESYVITLLSALLLAAGLHGGAELGTYPLAIGATGLVASAIGAQLIRLPASESIVTALFRGTAVSALVAAVGLYPTTYLLVGDAAGLGPASLYACALTGIAVAVVLMLVSEYFTGVRHAPVQRIAQASLSGHATNIITGLAVGLESVTIPVLAVCAGVLVSHYFAGLYGIGIAAVAMLSLTPAIVSLDSYGPITDNAGGISEMAGLPPEVRTVTDRLDAVGNTTKAVTKSFAIGSAGLAALVLFGVFDTELQRRGVALHYSLEDPHVLVGLLLGANLTFVFAGRAMQAVGAAAGDIVTEVRRQFREQPDILEGKAEPDYGRAVSLLTSTAIRKMLLPGLLPVALPLAVVLSPVADRAQLMGGLLVGVIVTGLLMALFMTTSGAAWDNAKKSIESGRAEGKDSPAYAAAVTGDTVGDPAKDTAGPAINPMIKILNLVALLMVPFLAG